MRHEHEAVFTCKEADELRGSIKGMASKNLFLQNKKKTRFFLVILSSTKQIDLKKFAEVVNEKKISLASGETLYKKLKLTPGSVSPFGLIHDLENEVEVYIDSDISHAETVSFHPNINTVTLDLSNKMFKKFLNSIPHKYKPLAL